MEETLDSAPLGDLSRDQLVILNHQLRAITTLVEEALATPHKECETLEGSFFGVTLPTPTEVAKEAEEVRNKTVKQILIKILEKIQVKLLDGSSNTMRVSLKLDELGEGAVREAVDEELRKRGWAVTSLLDRMDDPEGLLLYPKEPTSEK
jgi:hypothetical protein